MLFVNVYEIDRAYGGPEEGGWYFDCGTPEVSTMVLSTEGLYSDDWYDQRWEVPVGIWERVTDLRDALEAEFEPEPGTREVGSVLYRGGRYNVRVEDHPAREYPEESPTYS